MHCLNKLSTARKQHNFPKVRDLENELANWIEIDKHFLLAKTCNFSTNEAFALLRKLNGQNCVPTKVFLRHDAASDILEKANLLNTFFKSVYQPGSEMDLNSFVFQDVVCLSEVNFSVDEIQSQLLKIPDCSTAACDGVPPTIYNRAADILAPFVYLMLKSLLPGLIYGNAHILLLSTRMLLLSRADVENYRPISILPRISLIFERFLFNCIYSKLEHGFRSKHSTVTQLIFFLHKLHLNFDKNIEQVVVYLGFSKAFDSVDHSNLLLQLAIWLW